MAEQRVQNLDNVKQLESNDLKKENVLQVLDWEIERVVAENTQPVWTTWAIYGALAAVTWTLLDQLNSPAASMRSILLYFMMSQLSLDLLKQLPTIIAPHRSNKRKTQRYIFTNILASNRYQMLVETARAIVLISLAKSFAATVPATFTKLIYLYYGVVIITSIGALLASYLKWPLPIPNSSNPAIWIIPTLSFLLLLSPLMRYASELKLNEINMIDMKIAALLTAAVFLILALIEKKTDNPLLSSLVDIRRNLSFGHMALDDAIKQADIAIAGMQLRDVLQEDIKDIISSYEKISLEAEQIEEHMKVVSTQWPDKLCDLKGEQRNYISKEADLVLSKYKYVGDLVKNNEERLIKFKTKLLWLEAMMRSRPQEITEVVSLLDKAESDAKVKFKKNLETTLNLMKKTDQPCAHFKEYSVHGECPETK